MSEWISVDERLPDDGQEALIYHVLGDRARSPRAFDVARFRKGEWTFPWDRDHLPMQAPQWVTHWMPLAPPKS